MPSKSVFQRGKSIRPEHPLTRSPPRARENRARMVYIFFLASVDLRRFREEKRGSSSPSLSLSVVNVKLFPVLTNVQIEKDR